VADVSHELRTPLTAMRGNLKYCARRSARPQALDASLAAMEREVNPAGCGWRATCCCWPRSRPASRCATSRSRWMSWCWSGARLAPLAHGVVMVPDVAEQVEAIGRPRSD